LVLTGQMLDAKTAKEIGLIDEVIQPADIFNYISGATPTPTKSTPKLSANWKAIADFYEKNSFKSIINGKYKNGDIDKESIEKMAKTMSFKAPIAMKFAEELIDAAKGPSSELDKLVDIFSTKDAMLGLTSIGKKVEYKGE